MKTGVFSGLLFGMLLAFAGCTEFQLSGKPDGKQVEVLGRTWTVSSVADRPNAFVAWRDNNNLNPFGRPVALRTPQAVRALELATGCKVVPGRLWQDTTAEYHADMACPVAQQPPTG
ncbi:hypothetical protein [Sedimentitalea todarodis]|uniref:Lipoprotein n=1 Tax=Sedimentitalea todarodis TaxID=1631240 RepID=A0ABU3VFW4_9RHOB|nr:hypothetical protein [Sedimentitalea todarodis]MDU9005067.1 hypothetical protein [Sedimentitalea todarodis]